MKLDVNALRYLAREDFRTLQAVEQGTKNHEIVPVQLIDAIAGLRHGSTARCLKALLRQKLVHHDNAKYDGYRLTPLGYDYLALKALVNRGAVAAVGRQIGVGKEADVFEVVSPEGEVRALKLHRLGRTSFRAVKSKRDYLAHRRSFSWLYLSRLAALKEFAFMGALGAAGFPVPAALDHNRHAVLMSLVPGVPLAQVRELARPAEVYAALMRMLGDLAAHGLVHCDFNEFNLLVDDDDAVTLIDFPQMVSTSHANARELFARDVAGVSRFFARKLGYVPGRAGAPPCPPPDLAAIVVGAAGRGPGLDVQLVASGFPPPERAALDRFYDARAKDAGSSAGSDAGSDLGTGSEASLDTGSLASWALEAGSNAGPDAASGWQANDSEACVGSEVDASAVSGSHAESDSWEGKEAPSSVRRGGGLGAEGHACDAGAIPSPAKAGNGTPALAQAAGRLTLQGSASRADSFSWGEPGIGHPGPGSQLLPGEAPPSTPAEGAEARRWPAAGALPAAAVRLRRDGGEQPDTAWPTPQNSELALPAHPGGETSAPAAAPGPAAMASRIAPPEAPHGHAAEGLQRDSGAEDEGCPGPVAAPRAPGRREVQARVAAQARSASQRSAHAGAARGALKASARKGRRQAQAAAGL